MIKVVAPPKPPRLVLNKPPRLILNKPAIISRKPSSCSECGK